MEEGRGRRTLELLTTLLLGIAFILILVHEFLKWLYRLVNPKPKKTRQLTLAPFMHDRYPYERRWIVPEDEEIPEYGESTAELDLQDNEDN
jgi:hypothetical protein